jgi:hypothetical protein
MPEKSEIDIKLISAQPKIDEKVVEVYRVFKRCKEAIGRHDYEEERKKSWDATTKNKQWEDDEEKELEKQGMVPLVINKLNKGVQGSSAIVTDQKPEVKFYPVGSGDLYVAELLKRAHDYVWHKNEASDTTYMVVEERQIGGIGFWDAHFNPNKGVFGQIQIDESPPDDIYWDKESRKPDKSDTPLIKAKLRTPTYVKDKYDGLKDADLQWAPVSKSDASKTSGITGGDTYAEDLKNDPVEGADKDASTGEARDVWEIEAALLKTFKETWAVMTGPGGEVTSEKLEAAKGKNLQDAIDAAKTAGAEILKRSIEKRVLRIVVGKKLIEERINPYGVDSDGTPVCSLISLQAQRTLDGFPRSPTFYARPINKEKNKRRAQFIHAASHQVNSPIVRTEDSKWKGKPGTAGSELIMSKNTSVPPFRLSPGAMEISAFIQLEQLADGDIDDQYDMHDVMRGKLPSAGMAGRTVLALQDMGGMMSKPFLRALESGLVRLAKVVIAILLIKWPRSMWERLLEPEERYTLTPEGKLKFGDDEEDEEVGKAMEKNKAKWEAALERIRPADPRQPPGFKLIDLDVRLAAGSSMPTNRMARGQMAIEYTKAGIYDPQAALEYIDDPEKDKVIERLKKREEAIMQAKIQKGAK